MSKRILLALIVSCIAGVAHAELRVPAIIGDHMVLQRGASPIIWGWAEPGEVVQVSILRQTHEAITDPEGAWRVELKPVRATGPLAMTIEGQSQTIRIQDILVGEVWIASGQSNMQWTVSNSANAELEIANADYPDIRLFYVPRVVADTPQQNVDAEWTHSTSETVAGFSAVAYYFGRELHQLLKVPVGLIHTSWGGTPAESWTSREALEVKPLCVPILDRWEKTLADFPEADKRYREARTEYDLAVKKAEADGTPKPRAPGAPRGPNHPHRPSSLYNAMIHPLIPFAFQGAIWYQGESNASRAYQYVELFPAMIEDWRAQWGGRDFPFLFVQLANFRARKDRPGDSDWAELREAQRQTLNLKNTGMAVIIDIGEAGDIHPKNKQDVGIRLAQNALAKTYRRNVPYAGPKYKSMKVKGDRIILKFGNVGDGLVAMGGDLTGFSIAGEDRKFVWADARVDGKNVIVSADGVPNPVAVRYAWADNPACNLYDSSGLPASPFRTDDWPWTTKDNL